MHGWLDPLQCAAGCDAERIESTRVCSVACMCARIRWVADFVILPCMLLASVCHAAANASLNGVVVLELSIH
jgi:hypothetical protein